MAGTQDNNGASKTPPSGDGRPLKSIEASRTIATHTVVHGDMNGESRLFGGRLMEWIDEAAGITARRHCGGPVTTACVDQLSFKYPAYLNDIVVVNAHVTYVGRTSLEVRAESYVEDVATGEKRLINDAYLIEVHVDGQGRPAPIEYGLRLSSEFDRNEWSMAELRKLLRKERQETGV